MICWHSMDRGKPVVLLNAYCVQHSHVNKEFPGPKWQEFKTEKL